MIKKVTIETPLYEIQTVYDWFRQNLTTTTFHPEVSLMIYHNIQLLADAYTQIAKGIYDETKDPEYQEYATKMRGLYMQYMDRDEQGKPKLDERGNPLVTEMTVEFNEAREKLDKEYEELNKKLLKKNEANFNFINQKVKVDIATIDWDDLSKNGAGLPPTVVGFLCKEPVKADK